MLCLLLFLHLLIGAFLHRLDNMATTILKCKVPYCSLPNLWCQKLSLFLIHLPPHPKIIYPNQTDSIYVSIQCPQPMMHKPCFDPITRSPPHSKIIYPNQNDSDANLSTQYSNLWCKTLFWSYCLFTTPLQDNLPKSNCFWHRFRHTITPTYDARTLVLFNSKIIHPKQSDSNTSSSIQQPHFYHLRHGIPYPKQWVQQRWLADSLIWDNFTKRTASVRPYGALVKWEE